MNKFIKLKIQFQRHSKWLLLIILVEIVLLTITTLYIGNLLHNLLRSASIPVFLIYVIMGLIFTLYILFIIYRYPNPTDIGNRFTTLIYIHLFYFSLFAGFTYFINNRPLTYAPRLPAGTIGFRSWACNVTFSDIKIAYINPSNKLYWLDTMYINNPENWETTFSSYVDKNRKDIITVSTNCYHDDDGGFHINLINKGVKFNPPDSTLPDSLKNITVIKVIAKVEAASPPWDQYGDAQICFNVPTNHESEELYLGFSVGILDVYNSKLWIPALDWQPGNYFRDPISTLRNNQIEKSILDMESCYLTAWSYQNTIRLQIKSSEFGPSSILCESQYYDNPSNQNSTIY